MSNLSFLDVYGESEKGTHTLSDRISECVCVFVSVRERVCVCVLTTKSVLICFDILLMSLGSKRQRKVIGERKKENFSYFLKTFLFSERERKKSSNEIPI